MQGMQSNTPPEKRGLAPALTAPLQATKKYRERQRESEPDAAGDASSLTAAPSPAAPTLGQPPFWQRRPKGRDAESPAKGQEESPGREPADAGLSYGAPTADLQDGLDAGSGWPVYAGQSIEAAFSFDAVFQFETELEAEATEDWLDLSGKPAMAEGNDWVDGVRTLRDGDRASVEERARSVGVEVEDATSAKHKSGREWLDQQWLTRSHTAENERERLRFVSERRRELERREGRGGNMEGEAELLDAIGRSLADQSAKGNGRSEGWVANPRSTRDSQEVSSRSQTENPANDSFSTSDREPVIVRGAQSAGERSTPLQSAGERLAAMMGYSVPANAPDPKAVRAAIFRLAQESGAGLAAGQLASNRPLIEKDPAEAEALSRVADGWGVGPEAGLEAENQASGDPSAVSHERKIYSRDVTGGVSAKSDLRSALADAPVDATINMTINAEMLSQRDSSLSGELLASETRATQADFALDYDEFGKFPTPRLEGRRSNSERELPRLALLSPESPLANESVGQEDRVGPEDRVDRTAVATRVGFGPSLQPDDARSSAHSASISSDVSHQAEELVSTTKLGEGIATRSRAHVAYDLASGDRTVTFSADSNLSSGGESAGESPFHPGGDSWPTNELTPDLPLRPLVGNGTVESARLRQSSTSKPERPDLPEAGARSKGASILAANLDAKATVVAAAEGPALAHDASNLLSALKLYSELLSLSGVLQARHRHYAEDLKLLAGRSEVLIARLLRSISPMASPTAIPTLDAPVGDGVGTATASGARPETRQLSRQAGDPGSYAASGCLTVADSLDDVGSTQKQNPVGTRDDARSRQEPLLAEARSGSNIMGGEVDPTDLTLLGHLTAADNEPEPTLRPAQHANESQPSICAIVVDAQAEGVASAPPVRLHHLDHKLSVGEVPGLPKPRECQLAAAYRHEEAASHRDDAGSGGAFGPEEPAQEIVSRSAERTEDEACTAHTGASSTGAESINLVDLLTRWGSLLSMIAHGAVHIKFGPHAELPIPVAEEAMERILVNLVHNAMTATKNGGAIRIGVGCTEPGRPALSHPASEERARPANKVVLTVDDSGCGMSEEQIAKVFGGARPPDAPMNRSVQAEGDGVCQGDLRPSSDHNVEGHRKVGSIKPVDAGLASPRSSSGHGMGLQIVRELVAVSGGELAIFSRCGVGTRVEIQWPALKPEAAQEPQPGRIPPASVRVDRGASRPLLAARRSSSLAETVDGTAGLAAQTTTQDFKGAIAC